MKRISYVAACLLILLCASLLPLARAAGLFERLGGNDNDARDAIRSSLMNGGIYTNGALLKTVALGDRASLVNELGRYAKEYTKTHEFLEAYREYRESRKPSPPEEAKTVAELKEEQREQLKKGIAETEANLKTLPAELKPTMQEVLAMFRQQLADLDNPDNPMFSQEMDAMLRQGTEGAAQDYQQRLAQWEIEYPAAPTKMIRAWLDTFLKESRDVDFSASLLPPQHGLAKFANPAHEAKSPTWKMCYRAGREATEAARAFARQWLVELGS